MSGRNGRAPYGGARVERGRAGRTPRQACERSGGGGRFHWNIVSVGIIGAVLLAGVIAAMLLLPPGDDAKDPASALQAPAGTGAQTAPPESAAGQGTAGPAESAAPDGSDESAPPDETAAPDSSAAAGEAASEYFTDGPVQADGTTYRSAGLYVKITNVNEDGVNYYVADCRMRGGNRLFTALAGGRYALHKAEKTSSMARRTGAVVAINGDYYGYRTEGIVLRNGTLYRKTPYYDVAAIYGDGTMKTMDRDAADAEALQTDGALQAFGFGPMLLDADGKAFPEAEMKARQPKVNPANPRAGIGYIEPNHFVLVVVDGRGAGGSRGMTQTQFSGLFESLGCRSAYNFDGGGTATMVFMGKVINHPCDEGGERSVSDIVYFGESETDQANIARMGAP